MNYLIEFSNQQQLLHIDEESLSQVSEYLLSEEGVIEAELSIAIVNHEQMRSLNRDYLNHDYSTDVLSFLLNSESTNIIQPTDTLETHRGAGKSIEGQLILCSEMAIEMAEKFHWKPEDELKLYLVHGILHLLGYDDLSEPELKIMRDRERKILHHWGLNPHYAERPQFQDTESFSSKDESGDIL